MRNRIAVIHFSPLELYPPVQNLLRLLEQKSAEKRILVVSTHTVVKDMATFTADPAKIKLVRIGWSGQGIGLWKRYFTYITFNLLAVLYLLFSGVGKVFYYETISAYPAWIYKKILRRNTKLFIHYHEYSSPQDYMQGMKLVKYFHKLEMKLYPSCTWLSHTNIYRMERFLKDIEPLKVPNPQLVPNYPSVNWLGRPDAPATNVLKLVYVGAVSLDTMYVKEFATWVNAQNGEVAWDIYSSNITEAASRFLKDLDSKWIIFCGPVNYSSLPSVLKHYQAGIILYNGHSANYIFNAPNKLFEYLACGLDVLFPDILIGSLPYVTNMTYPKVMPLDFTKLQSFELKTLTERAGLEYKPGTFFYEEALDPLCKQLLNAV